MTLTPKAPISEHATANDTRQHRGFGPRVRRLHARIGQAHHQAEGMDFSRALLEELTPTAAAGLGARDLPWADLARTAALGHDLALVESVPATPDSAAAAAWCAHLARLGTQAPHRLLAHAYVRYGGDLSGGQQLAPQANAILAAQGLPALSFWKFCRPTIALKQALHEGFERLQLNAKEEEELLDEAEAAFGATQALLAELDTLA